jgi:hypothetical protein
LYKLADFGNNSHYSDFLNFQYNQAPVKPLAKLVAKLIIIPSAPGKKDVTVKGDITDVTIKNNPVNPMTAGFISCHQFELLELDIVL